MNACMIAEVLQVQDTCHTLLRPKDNALLQPLECACNGVHLVDVQDVGLARYIMHTHVATASVPMGTFAYAAPGALGSLGSKCVYMKWHRIARLRLQQVLRVGAA